MKKRGQQPDSYTYSIVLRGLALHAEHGKSLERALTVYHSMFAPNSRVQPSIIHTNATLKVCAQAHDLDALFGVAARLPRSGPRAADKATFTTIFNAIERSIGDRYKRVTDNSLLVNMDKRQRAVLQGRRMWADIIDRWKVADIMLDEPLIGAMGRLLLLADVPQDLDDVLSLLEQTMGIPRQAPRRLDRDEAQTLSEKDDESPAQEKSDLVQPTEAAVKPFADVDDDFVPGDEFLPLPSVRPMAYADPSQSTISLVLDACIRLKLFSAAEDYWGLLTGSPYNIIPDTNNYHAYLRLLRAQRESGQCVELVQEMRDGLGVRVSTGVGAARTVRSETSGVHVKSFRISLGACKRNIKDPKVVSHASELVRIMYDCFPEPDVRVLMMYVEVCREAVGHDWRSLSAALKTTETGVRQIEAALRYPPLEKDKDSEEYLDKCREVVTLLRALIGGYDRLLENYRFIMLPEPRKNAFKQTKKLASWQMELSDHLNGFTQSKDDRKNGSLAEDGKIPVTAKKRDLTFQRDLKGIGGERSQVREMLKRNARRQLEAASRTTTTTAVIPKEEQEEDFPMMEDDEDSKQWKKEKERQNVDAIDRLDDSAWKREALRARLEAEKYTAGGANRRMAMAQYLRRIENESM